MQVAATAAELYGRWTSDDLLFAVLVLVNEYVREVPQARRVVAREEGEWSRGSGGREGGEV